MIKPIHDRVVVKDVETQKTTAGGLILAPQAADKPNRGTVLAVGPGKHTDTGEFVATTVQEGQEVLYVHGAGQIVKIDDIEYRILLESEILAVVK